MTVHNLAFQGSFPARIFPELGLPASAYSIDGVEYYGSVGYLKAGLQLADRITTVSPTYAAEILTPDFGMGLDGLLRARASAVSGILNGIDEDVWNPLTDPHLAERFAAGGIGRRGPNKRALQQRFDLAPGAGTLLFGVISRLSWQKGLDLLLAALPRLLAENAQLVLLGSGEHWLEQGFRDAAAAAPGRIGVQIGYDEPLAHLIQGGVDALLVPSRFEPCGLTQLGALRYGAVPIVARVGGLNDTIVDANEMALAAGVATGFQFAPVTREGLEHALGRAASIWRRPEAWRRLQMNGMAAEVGWDRPAGRYAELYRELTDERMPEG
jgi:starch synthase